MLIQSEGLTGPDLIAAFVERWVLPLQGRPHLISQMSGRFDPCRLSTREMPHDEVSYMVNYIANCKLTEDWQYGKAPYSRAYPPPMVNLISFFLCPIFFSGRLLTSRLVFNQNPLLHPSAGTTGAEREFAPDREADDSEDADLGASRPG